MMPTMGAPQMAPQQQYQSQQQQQPPHQQWMAPQQQPPQQQYQVPPPQQQSAAAYYYQQHPQQHLQPQQQYSASAGADSQHADGVRSLWVGDLLYWMDEQYLLNCFAQTGEPVVSAKVIRNKQTAQSEGYGFLEFSSHAAAEKALQTYNGTLMPNSEQGFRLNWASMGAGEKRTDDSSDFTVFVGDLAGDVNDFMLQETFRLVYPSVKGAKVVTDRLTGRTKGYGFVKFADESEQLRAMSEMNGRFISTRPMRVGPAANKKSSMNGQPKASYQGSQGSQSEDDPSNTTLFVGNLDVSVAEEDLRQVFGQYGSLLHVKIPVGKRCGFVQFADRSSAEEAMRVIHGTVLGGQNVRISWGHSPSNKQPQADQNQWNTAAGAGYYGGYPAAPGGAAAGGYDAYGYAAQAAAAAAAAGQDPNMYYQGYPGYGSYAAQQQQHQQQQPPQ